MACVCSEPAYRDYLTQGHQVRLWSSSQNLANLATRVIPADELIHINLWWHSPSWLTDYPSQWPSWKSTQFQSKMFEQNTKQSPGPHVMYETTTPPGIPRESSWYPLTSHLPLMTSAQEIFLANQTIYSERLRFALYPKTTEEDKGQLTSDVISQAKIMREKNVQKSAFTPAINAVKQNSRNNLKN